MADVDLLQRLHERVLRTFIDTGHAPTYLDLARAEGLPPEEARAALRELMPAAVACWQYPGTDHIVSYAPFNNVPTWHRVTIEGDQKWTAQCGFESLAITHLFPGKEVTIDSICRDCAEPVQVKMRDGEVVSLDPPEAVGHTKLPLARWFDDLPTT
ncbi:MAG TPA: organomercurial lyase [Chloroflexota bacterium]|jgi:hypothetical protein